ncbi:hypothetical protein ANAPC2_01376 [Anaplasma phagocytophilum]|nr:hypothetical protein ANAPC2_01376 [Anaplasma phagocytophilum]
MDRFQLQFMMALDSRKPSTLSTKLADVPALLSKVVSVRNVDNVGSRAVLDTGRLPFAEKKLACSSATIRPISGHHRYSISRQNRSSLSACPELAIT